MWNEALIGIGIPIVRSVAGWLDISLKDKKISRLEVRKLIETVVRVGTIEIVLYFGLNSAGINIDMMAAGCGAFIADKLLGALKENKNVR